MNGDGTAHRLSVGDFSRMTHLSVSTLRHYHDVGLLEPAEVNPETGYRYYAPEQIGSAQVIRRLRDLQMPVPDIKAVLAADQVAGRNALITSHLDSLQAELARTQDAVDSLRALLEPGTDSFEVDHRSVPATPAIAIQQVVARGEVGDWWQGALGELHATANAQRLTVTGCSGGMFESDLFQHERGLAVVFLPIEGKPRPVGRVESIVVPPAELAVATHLGSHADIDVVYGRLGSYATERQINVDGPLREYYPRDAWQERDPANWVTEIGWPIFRADGSA
jgi:DNA-binding transcriptional MerR regulator